MKFRSVSERGVRLAVALVLICYSLSLYVTAQTTGTAEFCGSCVRKNLSYLAGPSLRGRGSGTIDELHAAQFIARSLRQYGLSPAAGNGHYIQTASAQSQRVIKAPVLSLQVADSGKLNAMSGTHGHEITVLRLSRTEISGPLQKLDLTNPEVSPNQVKSGAVLLLELKAQIARRNAESLISRYLASQAAMVIVPESVVDHALSDSRSKRLPHLAKQGGSHPSGQLATLVAVNVAAFDQLWKSPDGALVKLRAEVASEQEAQTWNVLAKIEGTTKKDQVILLSAHLDHLGVKRGKIYYGADDDASGVAAIMELARAMAKQPRPRRTVVFAFWGSEEAGMMGAHYFLQHPTFELSGIVANLEFEMIARPDPKLESDELWLAGWDRTNLGPALVAQGAKVAADPHPDQNFFARSDNYALAQHGIVAQTVSSFGLHKDYHQPTDTLDKVDWQHLDDAIASMIGPITWLANSDFSPQWNPEEKP